MKIRAMTRDDISAAFALEQVLYPVDAWSLGQFIDELSRVPESRFYIVAESEGGVVGYAGLFVPHVGADADIQTLSVAPAHQRQGIGRKLLESLIEEAQRRLAPALHLEVRVDNEPAIALYHDYGFEVMGRRRNYYGRGIDATTMRKVLT